MSPMTLSEFRAMFDALTPAQGAEVVRGLRAMLKALPEEPMGATDARQRDLLEAFLLGYGARTAEKA